MKKIKTTKITNEPSTPINKFVQAIWYQANEKNVSEFSLSFINYDKIRLLLGEEEIDPPPVNLFKPILMQFLDYTGVKIWPWTKSIKNKLCCIEIDGIKTEWSMQSDNISKSLIIKKSY